MGSGCMGFDNRNGCLYYTSNTNLIGGNGDDTSLDCYVKKPSNFKSVIFTFFDCFGFRGKSYF